MASDSKKAMAVLSRRKFLSQFLSLWSLIFTAGCGGGGGLIQLPAETGFSPLPWPDSAHDRLSPARHPAISRRADKS